MDRLYILDSQGEPKQVDDFAEWGKWMETADCRVMSTVLPDYTWISTVFLALDHNHFGGPPLLYETMIFGGPLDQRQRRTTTRVGAVASHQQLVAEHLAAKAEVYKLLPRHEVIEDAT